MWVWNIEQCKAILVDLNNGIMISRNVMGPLILNSGLFLLIISSFFFFNAPTLPIPKMLVYYHVWQTKPHIQDASNHTKTNKLYMLSFLYTTLSQRWFNLKPLGATESRYFIIDGTLYLVVNRGNVFYDFQQPNMRSLNVFFHYEHSKNQKYSGDYLVWQRISLYFHILVRFKERSMKFIPFFHWLIPAALKGFPPDSSSRKCPFIASVLAEQTCKQESHLTVS